MLLGMYGANQRIDVVEFARLDEQRIIAQCGSAPPADPANNAFFRLGAIKRIDRSTSSMKRSGLRDRA